MTKQELVIKLNALLEKQEERRDEASERRDIVTHEIRKFYYDGRYGAFYSVCRDLEALILEAVQHE